jgi:hypothetical protein
MHIDSIGGHKMKTIATRRFRALLGTFAALASGALVAAGTAAADPTGNANWLTFSGTCNGQQVQFLDPPGPGPSNFVVGGSVGVGMIFKWSNLATGELLQEQIYGRGVDEARLTHCAIVVPHVPTPAGTIDVLFEVWGLVTPQGT